MVRVCHNIAGLYRETCLEMTPESYPSIIIIIVILIVLMIMLLGIIHLSNLKCAEQRMN